MADDQFDASAAVDAYLSNSTPTNLKTSMVLTAGQNPDYEAETRRLGQQLGLPSQTIANNIDDARKQASIAGFDADSYAKNFPTAAKYLADPNNAAIAHDDKHTLANTEKLLTPQISTWNPSMGERLSSWWQGLFGVPQIQQAQAMNAFASGQLDPALHGTAPTMTPGDARNAVGGMSEVPDQAVSKGINMASFGLLPDTAGPATTTAGQVGGAAGSLGGFLIGGPLKAADMLLGHGIERVAGESFAKGLGKDVVNQGAKLGVATGLSGIGNDVNSPDVATGLNKFANDTASGAATGAVFGTAGRIFPDNTITQAAARIASLNFGLDAINGTSPVDTVENWNHLSDTEKTDKLFNYGLNTIFGLTGAGRTEGGWFHDNPVVDILNGVKQAGDTQQGFERLASLGQVAAQSKLRERDPEAFKDFVSQASENSDIPAVYIDASKFNDVLNQSGVNNDQLRQVLPDVADQMHEALQTNGTVRIPTEDYLTHIAGGPLEQSMLPEMRITPGGKTYSEVQDETAQMNSQLTEKAQQIADKKAADDAFHQSRQAVFDDVQKQVMDTGRFSPDVAKTYAALHRDFFTVLGDKLGMAPDEAYRQHGARVVGDDLGGGQQYNQGMDLPYQIDHKPMTVEGGASTIDDLTPSFGEDIYGKDALQFFGSGDAREQAVVKVLKSLRGKPNAEVTIYRGVPDGVGKINPGDWVTLSKEAAQDYATQHEGGRVISMKVPARHVTGWADSLLEFGYHPTNEGGTLNQSSPTLDAVRQQWDAAGITHHISEKNGAITLSRIVVPEADRGAGKGTAAIQSLVDYADQTGQRVMLTPSADFGGNKKRLTEFYKRFGFVENKGKNKDFTTMERMIREPNILHQTDGNTTARGFYSPESRTIGLLKNADLSSFIHESGHFFLDTYARIAAAPDAPVGIKSDMDSILKWLGVRGGEVVHLNANDRKNGADLADMAKRMGMTPRALVDAWKEKPPKPNGSQGVLWAKMDGIPELALFAAENPGAVSRPGSGTALDVWHSMSIDEQREAHEQFARGFESYLMEGKAPNLELQTVFARVKSWMLNVYQSLKNLNVDLNPEVRGVFDRMLASERTIREAESARVFEPLWTDKPEGADDEAWQSYQSAGQEATQEAIDAMQAKSVKDMKWLSNAKSKAMKALQREAKTERDTIKAEITKQVEAQPIEQARKWLKTGEMKDAEGNDVKAEKGFKLNSQDLKTLYPDGKLDNPDLAKLRGLTSPEGLHPDLIAEMFGFSSGDRLVRELANEPDAKDKINAATDQRMLEQHGELTTPEAIARTAEELIHNDARARFMATGLKILAKSAIPVRQLVKGAIEAAEAAVARKKVKDLSYKQYAAAESRSNKEAIKLAPKDPEGAVKAQRAALLNNRLVKATMDAQDDMRRAVTYFKRFDKESVRKSMPGQFIEQIDALLDRFDFRQNPSLVNRPKESLLNWANGLREAGYEPQIADWLNEFTQPTHYKDLSVEQMRGLYDTVRSIEATAKSMREVMRAGKMVSLDSAVNDLVAKMDERGEKFTKDELINPPVAKVDGIWKSVTHWMGVKLRMVDTDLMPQEYKTNRYDMQQLDGPFREMLLNPMFEASYRKVDMTKAVSDAAAKVGEVLGPEWQKQMFDLVDNQTLPDPRLSEPGKPVMMKLTRAKLLGMMRHLGNESNFDKLTKGYGWNPNDVWRFVMKNATQKDWLATQAHWDSFDPLWKQTEEMVRRIGGVAPPKIPAREFDTPFGKMRGGYSPIDYDPISSKLSVNKGEFDLGPGEKVGGNILYRATTTSNSSLNNRVQGYTDYVNLDIHSADSRIRDTIHDLAYREALLDVAKITDHPDFREKFMLTYGKEEYQALKTWMKDIRDMYLIDPRNRGFENAMQYARQGVVMTGIAYRVSTVIKHGSSAALKSLGYLGSGEGAKYFAARVTRMASGHLQEDIAGAKEKFAEIRTRMLQMDRDYRVHNRSMYEPEDWRAKNDRFGHAMVAWSDALSAIPTAWAAYDLAKTSGIPESMGGTGKPLSEAQAVAYANSTVRQAHGTALESARSNFMQAKGAKGLFGTIYGFMNNTYGQTRDMFSKAFTRGNFNNNPALVARAMATVIMPAVIAHWVSHGGPDDSKDESWYGWVLKAIGGEVGAMVPFVRDATAMLTWEHTDNAVAPLRLVSDAIKSGKDIGKEAQGQQSKIIQDMANTIGEWAHIGGLGQAGKSLQYLRDVQNGKQNPQSAADYAQGMTIGVHKH